MKSSKEVPRAPSGRSCFGPIWNSVWVWSGQRSSRGIVTRAVLSTLGTHFMSFNYPLKGAAGDPFTLVDLCVITRAHKNKGLLGMLRIVLGPVLICLWRAHRKDVSIHRGSTQRPKKGGTKEGLKVAAKKEEEPKDSGPGCYHNLNSTPWLEISRGRCTVWW